MVKDVSLLRHYREVRARTEALAAPLSPEDQQLQSMPDASPVKWHRAHTTWFFETFVLTPFAPEGGTFHPAFRALFNSYYDGVGDRHPRPERGLLSRPSAEEVRVWRAEVDARVEALLSARGDEPQVAQRVALGLHHEQQHQELLLTDLLHAFSRSALRPEYLPALRTAETPVKAPPLTFRHFDGGVYEVGHAGEGFAFDNEGPRHRVFLAPFALAERPVTCGEYLAFIADGGYQRPELWLSEGWALAQAERWEAPLYWEERDDGAWTFSLRGMRRLAHHEPVCHVSHYEADAYARWAGGRLPLEAEWELAATGAPVEGNLLEGERYLPAPCDGRFRPFGDVWEWTSSPYVAYPGFRPLAGVLGEYNGKFMSNQMVLRGGSFATARSHLRASYRNFFPSRARWQFSGVRLAKDP